MEQFQIEGDTLVVKYLGPVARLVIGFDEIVKGLVGEGDYPKDLGPTIADFREVEFYDGPQLSSPSDISVGVSRHRLFLSYLSFGEDGRYTTVEITTDLPEDVADAVTNRFSVKYAGDDAILYRDGYGRKHILEEAKHIPPRMTSGIDGDVVIYTNPDAHQQKIEALVVDSRVSFFLGEQPLLAADWVVEANLLNRFHERRK